jgi:IPT/TIG domain
MRAFTWVLAATALTAAVLGVGPLRVVTAQSFQQSVKVTAPPNAGSNPDANLNSLACTSVGNCVGVGSYTDSSGNTQAMAATENNGAWRQAVEVTAPVGAASNPNATLNGISCTSAGNCEAVGSYDHTSDEAQAMAVAETNGTWAKAVKVSLPAGGDAGVLAGLYDVSCTSSGDCEAVGSYENTSPPPTTLAMAATETNGTWGQAVKVSSPGSGGTVLNILEGVTCTSAGNCEAVGLYGNSVNTGYAMAATETGGTWRQAVAVTAPAGAYGSPPQSSLDSLSCTSAGNCEAVGSYPLSSSSDQATEATETNGSWGQAVAVTSPTDAGSPPFVVLTGLSCTSAGNCQAVGYYTDSSSDNQAMSATETNGNWAQATKVTAPADSASNPSATLNGISCTSAGNCEAVGSYTNSSGNTQAMAASERAAPRITGFTPSSGPIGTKVTIRGTDLSGATKVTFNGRVATITSDTATKIVVHVPTGATTGKINVKTPGGTAKSATEFTVT